MDQPRVQLPTVQISGLLSAHVASPENTLPQESYFRLVLLTDLVFLDRTTFFIRYDEPVNAVYGLSIREETGGPSIDRVCELDADLQCIRTLEVIEVLKTSAFEPVFGFMLR